jgi:biopolymer transport protein TolR
MGMSSGSNNKKELNFELNLLPIFDVLSVCICFLLMTVVWVQVGSVDTSQAVGGQSQEETKKPPTVWVTFDDKANLNFSFKNAGSKVKDFSLKSSKGQINYEKVQAQIKGLDQGLEIALLMPAANTSYDSIIQVMDIFKQAGIKDVGISPL